MRTHGKNSTYAVGCRCDACRKAHNEVTSEWRRYKQTATKERFRRLFPKEPLLQAIERKAQREGIAPSRIHKDVGLNNGRRLSQEFYSDKTIDHACCALGMHPTELYGNDWIVA